MTTISKSSIMTAYNKALRCGKFDPQRVNRALGIAMSKSTVISPEGKIDAQSKTNPGDFNLATFNSCTCQDAKRGHICKHRIAYALLKRAYEYETVSEVK